MPITSPATSPMRFNGSNRFSLGVEEELIAVDPATLLPLRRDGGPAGPRRARGRARHRRGHRRRAGAARRRCATTPARPSACSPRCARELAAFTPLLGAGVHPLGRVGDVAAAHGRALRADRIAACGPLMRQTPHCGVHVHVGDARRRNRDPRLPTACARGSRCCRRSAPTRPTGTAATPGLASTRSVICNSLPRSGMPARLRRLRRLRGDGGGAARPRRVPRTPATCGGTCARTRGAARSRSARWTRSPRSRTWSRWSRSSTASPCTRRRTERPRPRARARGAARAELPRHRATGSTARLALDGALRPVREVALPRASRSRARYAADLGCWEELMLVHRAARAGNGATRQRANAEQGGVRLMLRRLAWTRPRPPGSAAASRRGSLSGVLRFETAIGACGVRWSEAGLTRVSCSRRRSSGVEPPSSCRGGRRDRRAARR